MWSKGCQIINNLVIYHDDRYSIDSIEWNITGKCRVFAREKDEKKEEKKEKRKLVKKT